MLDDHRSLYEFLVTPSPLLSQLVPAAALSSILDEDEVMSRSVDVNQADVEV